MIGGPIIPSHTSNGLDLRVRKTVGMTTTNYAWDLAMSVPAMLSDGPFSEYIYGHDLIGKVVTSGGTTATYAHADVLGSLRLLTDGTGTEVGTAQYDAFGAVRSQTGVQLPLGFTGEQRDSESGLVYLRARYYDPKTGRFLTKDPVRGRATRPASQHAYAYAHNNPVRFTDPTGRFIGEDGLDVPITFDDDAPYAWGVDKNKANPHDPDDKKGECEPGPCTWDENYQASSDPTLRTVADDCSYYQQRCAEVDHPTSQYYYCELALTVCRGAGRSRSARCIRSCLQSYDRNVCVPRTGRSDSAGVGAVCHEIEGHAFCVTKCALQNRPQITILPF